MTDVIELRVPGDCDYPGGSKMPPHMFLYEVEDVRQKSREQRNMEKTDIKSEAWI